MKEIPGLEPGESVEGWEDGNSIGQSQFVLQHRGKGEAEKGEAEREGRREKIGKTWDGGGHHLGYGAELFCPLRYRSASPGSRWPREVRAPSEVQARGGRGARPDRPVVPHRGGRRRRPARPPSPCVLRGPGGERRAARGRTGKSTGWVEGPHRNPHRSAIERVSRGRLRVREADKTQGERPTGHGSLGTQSRCKTI